MNKTCIYFKCFNPFDQNSIYQNVKDAQTSNIDALLVKQRTKLNNQNDTTFQTVQTIQAGEKILGGLIEDEHYKILPVLMEVRLKNNFL